MRTHLPHLPTNADSDGDRTVRGPITLECFPMVPQELLDILVCPVCKTSLTLKPDGVSLKCRECRRVYPIRDDIPVMLVDEAVIEPS